MKRLLLAVAASLAVLACADGTAPVRQAVAPLRITLPLGGLSAQLNAPIDSVTVDVTAPDLTGSARYVFRNTPAKDTITATMSVPVGVQRTFTVVVYAGGTSVAIGATTVDVVPGNNPPITLVVRAVLGNGGPSATGMVTLVITAVQANAHITPKTATANVGDTVRFKMVDDQGVVFTDPINFPSTWKYDPNSYVVPDPKVGLIYWATPSSLCGQIDASGLLRVTHNACTFKVVGRIGAQADTATVTVP